MSIVHVVIDFWPFTLHIIYYLFMNYSWIQKFKIWIKIQVITEISTLCVLEISFTERWIRVRTIPGKNHRNLHRFTISWFIFNDVVIIGRTCLWRIWTTINPIVTFLWIFPCYPCLRLTLKKQELYVQFMHLWKQKQRNTT